MIRTALALGIVLEVVEILRRAPTWLLILVGVLVSYFVLLVIAYFWWIAGALGGIALFRLAGLRIVRQRS
jgi:hypothetical protein